MSETPIHKIASEKDLEPLIELLQRIVGQPCCRAIPSYGATLHLELGKQIMHVGRPPTADWSLSTEGTRFSILLNEIETFVSDQDWDDAAQKAKLKLFEGKIVTGVTIGYPSLSLRVDFSDYLALLVQPTREDDEFEVVYWDLITPEATLIEVGPNREWSHRLNGESRFW